MKKTVNNFRPFEGQHCETTTIGNLIKNIDIALSEPMLFGLGEGLGYIFWNMKIMDFPFIGGRIKPDLITKNVTTNLQLKLTTNETNSTKKAWEVVKEHIDNNIPVGLKLDSYYLDYFTNKIHFAGHYVTIYGYDDEYAYLIDTIQQGKEVKATLENVKLARNEKGPMSSRNLSFIITKSSKLSDIKKVIPNAIKRNAEDFLNPPIKNIGYKGIEKTSKEIFKWFNTSKNIDNDFKLQARLMEKAGTGGALFRNIYRDFLRESYELLKIKQLEIGYVNYSEIAKLWNKVASLFDKVGETKDIDYLKEASEIFVSIAQKEKNTMEILNKI